MTKRGLRRVFVVQIDLVRGSDDFAVRVVAAGRAHMMRALQLATVAAFCRITGNQRIVATPHVTARFGDFILGDSHVSTSVIGGQAP
jgi:hypothetical protein